MRWHSRRMAERSEGVPLWHDFSVNAFAGEIYNNFRREKGYSAGAEGWVSSDTNQQQINCWIPVESRWLGPPQGRELSIRLNC